MAAFGKIELDNFRERASMGRQGTAKQDRIPTGEVPYGYCIGEDGRAAIVEDEAEVVRRMFHQSVNEGMGVQRIAKQLMADGIPTRSGGAYWHHSSVGRILGNDTYKGTWWFGKRRHMVTESGRQPVWRKRTCPPSARMPAP